MPVQIVEIPFGGGVNEDVDDKLLPQPFLLDMRNAEFDKAGALNRRSGHIAVPQQQFGLTDGLDISTTPPIRLAKWRDSLVMVTKIGLYIYEPVVNLWSLAYYMTPALPARAPIARDVGRPLNDGTVASVGGYEAHCWRDVDGFGGFTVYFQIYEESSRATVFPVDQAVAGSPLYSPRIVVVGTNFCFIWLRNNGGVQEIRMRQVDTATLVVHADVVIATDVNAAARRMDAAPYDADHLLIAYYRNDGRVVALRHTLSTAITLIRSLALTTSDPDSVAICGTAGEDVFCAWNDSGSADSTRLAVLDPSFAVLIASTAVTPGAHAAPQIGVCRASSSSAHVVWEQTSAPRSIICHREMSTAGAGLTALQLRYGYNLQSKPFTYGSDPIVSGQQDGAFVMVGYVSDVQGSLHLWRLAPSYVWGQEVGVFAPRESGAERTTSHLSDVAQIEPGRFRISATVKTRILTSATSSYLIGTTGIDAIEVNFTPSLADDTRALAFEASENLWIAGTRPSFFDGRFPWPAAFPFSPDDLDTGGLPVVGGGHLTAGTYQYVAVFELQDTRGNLLRSEVLVPPISVTVLGPTDRATVTVPDGPVVPVPQGRQMVRLYRTMVNKSGPFFRVASAPSIGGLVSLTFLDGLEDVVIQANEAVYTDGNVLPNVPPPPSGTIAVIEDRVFLADGRDVWYSKQFVPGEIPGWSEQLVFRVEQGGDIVAIAQMDDAPILFKRSSIFQVGDGEGFGDDGSGTNFKAKPIATGGVGCVDARSIVLGPEGLYFKAPAGIYCLTRGLEVVFIGQPVRDHVRDLYPICTSATLIPEKQQVIWTLTDGIEGRAVIYDYRRQQWAIWEIEGGAIVTSACFLDGTYYYATATGVRRSDPDTWTDAAVPYEMSAKTAWVKVGGIQGYQQCRRATFMLANRGSHELSISVLTNYNGTILTEGYTWTAAELAALPSEQVSIHLRNQKCQAIAFEIADDSSPGESCVITSIRLEVEVKRTGARQLLAAGARK